MMILDLAIARRMGRDPKMNRRVKTALMMARLTAIKTLAGFDFGLPSLDRNRILALAELRVINRAEVVHLLGPPGTGKSLPRPLSQSRPSRLGTASPSRRSPTSSPRSSGPRRTERCAIVSAISAAPHRWSSTRSASCLSCPAAAICSSSSSSPAMRRAT